MLFVYSILSGHAHHKIWKTRLIHIKGIKIGRQANALWVEKFDKRQSPMGRDYYWLTGEFIDGDKGKDTDEWALSQGYISIVPTQFDLTAHHAIQELNSWGFEN